MNVLIVLATVGIIWVVDAQMLGLRQPTSSYGGQPFATISVSGDINVGNSIHAHLRQNSPPTWNVEQQIPSKGAVSWEFFEMGNQEFLVSANHWDGVRYNIDSALLSRNAGSSDAFTLYQNLPTKGALSWKHFVCGNRDFLVVANYYDDVSMSHSTNSTVYGWNGTRFVQEASIPSFGATDVAVIPSISARVFIVVGNFEGNYSTDTSTVTNIPSSVYTLDASTMPATVGFLQNLPQTMGVNSLDWFSLGSDTVGLCAANNYNWALNDFATSSQLFLVNTTASTFSLQYSVPVTGASRCRHRPLDSPSAAVSMGIIFTALQSGVSSMVMYNFTLQAISAMSDSSMLASPPLQQQSTMLRRQLLQLVSSAVPYLSPEPVMIEESTNEFFPFVAVSSSNQYTLYGDATWGEVTTGYSSNLLDQFSSVYSGMSNTLDPAATSSGLLLGSRSTTITESNMAVSDIKYFRNRNGVYYLLSCHERSGWDFANHSTLHSFSSPHSALPTLSGTLSVPLDPVSLTANFTDLAIDIAGGSYLLSFTYANGLFVTEFPILVNPGPQYALKVLSSPILQGLGGDLFQNQPTLWVVDCGGNVVPLQNNTYVRVSAANVTIGGANLVANLTAGTFNMSWTDLSINTAGNYTLTFSIPGMLPLNLPAVVTPGPANYFTIVTQPSSATYAGSPFSSQPVLRVQDRGYNNLQGMRVVVAASGSPSSFVLNGNLTITTDGSGLATFTDLFVTKMGTRFTLSFSVQGTMLAASSSSFQVNVGPSHHLILTNVLGNAVAGMPLVSQPAVAISDRFNNTGIFNSSSVSLYPISVAVVGPSPSPLVGTTTILPGTATGIATFADLVINPNGSAWVLQFSCPNLIGVSSNPFAVAIGNPFSISLQQRPSGCFGQVACTVQPIVTALDKGGNLIPSYAPSQASVVVTASTIESNGVSANPSTAIGLSPLTGLGTYVAFQVNIVSSAINVTFSSPNLQSAVCSVEVPDQPVANATTSTAVISGSGTCAVMATCTVFIIPRNLMGHMVVGLPNSAASLSGFVVRLQKPGNSSYYIDAPCTQDLSASRLTCSFSTSEADITLNVAVSLWGVMLAAPLSPSSFAIVPGPVAGSRSLLRFTSLGVAGSASYAVIEFRDVYGNLVPFSSVNDIPAIDASISGASSPLSSAATVSSTSASLAAGQILLSFVSTVSGNMRLNVRVNGAALGGDSNGTFPFTVNASLADPSGSTFSSPPATIPAGISYSVLVYLKDRYGNAATGGVSLSASLTSSALSMSSTLNVDTSVDPAVVSVLSTRSGTFNFQVLLFGIGISGSPVSIAVTPRSPSAGQCVLAGVAALVPPKTIRSLPTQVAIILRDAYGNTFDSSTITSSVISSVSVSSSTSVASFMVVASSTILGAVETSLTFATEGTYTIAVLVQGSHASGSPFSLQVLGPTATQVSPSLSTATIVPSSTLKAGNQLQAQVQLRGTDSLPVSSSVSGLSAVLVAPSSSTRTALAAPTISQVDWSQTFTAASLTVAGTYTLEITFSADTSTAQQHVSGSPFSIPVIAADPSPMGISLRQPQDSPFTAHAGSSWSTTFSVADQYGNPVDPSSFSASTFSSSLAMVGTTATATASVAPPSISAIPSSNVISVMLLITVSGSYSMGLAMFSSPATSVIGSPFVLSVVAAAANGPASLIVLDAFTNVVAGKPATGQVLPRDAYGNPTVLTAPVKASIQNGATDATSMSSFSVIVTQAGKYMLSVSLSDDTAVAASPYSIAVSAAATSAYLTIWSNTTSARAGVPFAVLVSTMDMYGNARSVGGDNMIVSATGGVDQTSVSDLGTGSYTVSFTPPSPGTYVLSVRLPVMATATSVTVAATAGPARGAFSSAKGAGLSGSTAGVAGTFNVVTRDSLGNSAFAGDAFGNSVLSCSIASTNFNCTCSGGTQATSASCQYTITQSGSYSLSLQIKSTGESVSGSPFAFLINPGAASPAAMTMVEQDPVVVVAASSAILTVQPRDAYGNLLSVGGLTDSIFVDASSTGGATVSPSIVAGVGFSLALSANSAGQQQLSVVLVLPNGAGSLTRLSPAASFGYTVVAGPISPKSSYATVSGSAVAGVATSFSIVAMDAFSNLLSNATSAVVAELRLVTAGYLLVPVSVYPNGTAWFTVTAAASTWTLSARTMSTGMHLSGSPYTMTVVSGSTNPALTEVSCDAVVAVGSDFGVQVQTKDSWQNPTSGADVVVKVTFMIKDGAALISAQRLSLSGTQYSGILSTSTSITAAGTYIAVVEVNGVNAANKTVSFVVQSNTGAPVVPSSTTSSVDNFTPTVTAGSTIVVYVRLRDSLGLALRSITNSNNVLSATVSDPTNSAQVSVGTAQAGVVPITVTSGTKAHVAAISLLVSIVGGSTISGSPFAINVLAGAASAAKSSLIVPFSVTAGTAFTITLISRDAYGNLLLFSGLYANSISDLSASVISAPSRMPLGATFAFGPGQSDNSRIANVPMLTVAGSVMFGVAFPDSTSTILNSTAVSVSAATWSPANSYLAPSSAFSLVAGNSLVLSLNFVDVYGNSALAPASPAQIAALCSSALAVTVTSDPTTTFATITATFTQAMVHSLAVGSRNGTGIDVQVQGSPISIAVSPAAAVASRSGVGAEGVVAKGAGIASTFSVVAKDMYGNVAPSTDRLLYRCSMIGAGGSVAVSSVASTKTVDASSVFSFLTTTSGSYTLQVTRGSQNVEGSPIQLTVPAGIISASTSSLNGSSSSIRGTVGVPVQLTIIARDAYGNAAAKTWASDPAAMTVSLVKEDTNEKVVSTSIVASSADDSVAVASVMVTKPGIWIALAASGTGEQFYGSGASVLVLPGPFLANQSSCSGDGMVALVAGTLATISCNLKDSWGNAIIAPPKAQISVTATSPSVNMAVVGSPSSSRVLSATFVATIAAVYTVSVSYQNVVITTVAGVQCTPSVLASPSSWSHEILDNSAISAGSTATISINGCDQFGNKLSRSECTSTCSGILTFMATKSQSTMDPISAVVTASGAAAGSYFASMSFTVSGQYVMTATARGQPMAASPYSFVVAPGAISAPACSVEGTGILGGVVGSAATFSIVLRDKYKNVVPATAANTASLHVTLSPAVSGFSTAIASNVVVASFSPSDVATISISAVLDTSALSGSPFTANFISGQNQIPSGSDSSLSPSSLVVAAGVSASIDALILNAQRIPLPPANRGIVAVATGPVGSQSATSVQASLHTVTFKSNVAGSYLLLATLSDGSAIAGGCSIVVQAGSISALQFQQDTTTKQVVAGTSGYVPVTAVDAFGNAVTDSSQWNSASWVISVSSSALSATPYYSSVDSAASSPSQQLKISGTTAGVFTVGLKLSSISSSSSLQVNVVAAAFASAALPATLPTLVTAGNPLSLSLTMVDQYGNTIAEASPELMSCTATPSDPSSAMITARSDSKGLVNIVLTSACDHTIQLSGPNGNSIGSFVVSVIPGALSPLGSHIHGRGVASAKVGIRAIICVDLADAYGNDLMDATAIAAGVPLVSCSFDPDGVTISMSLSHDNVVCGFFAPTQIGSGSLNCTMAGAMMSGFPSPVVSQPRSSPQITSAAMSSDGSSISVTFSAGTNRGQPLFTGCGCLSSSLLTALTSKTKCRWQDDSTFSIFIHPSATVQSGDPVQMAPGSVVTKDKGSLPCNGITTLSPPSNPVLPIASLKATGILGVCDSQLVLDGSASLCGFRASYIWALVKGGPSTTNNLNIQSQLLAQVGNSVAAIPRDMLEMGVQYVFGLKVQDAVGTSEVSTVTTVKVDGAVPLVTIEGGNEHSCYPRSTDCIISGSTTMPCGAAASEMVGFQWVISNISSASLLASSVGMEGGKNRTVRITTDRIPVGTVLTLELRAFPLSTPSLIGRAVIALTMTARPLVSVIKGAPGQVTLGTVLHLDGRSSSDPEEESKVFSFFWSCQKKLSPLDSVNGQTLGPCTKDLTLIQTMAQDADQLSVDTALLGQGTFVFTLQVSKEPRASSSVVTVNVAAAPKTPTAVTAPLALMFDVAETTNLPTNKRVSFSVGVMTTVGQTTQAGDKTNLNCTWALSGGLALATLSVVSDPTSAYWVAAPSSVADGQTYTLSVTCKHRASGHVGATSLQFSTNPVPVGGTCTVVASCSPSCVAMMDTVTLQCSNWQDIHKPLTYLWSIYDPTTGKTTSLFPYATRTEQITNVNLPSGDKNNNYLLTLQACVFDSLGANTCVTTTFRVIPATDTASACKNAVANAKSLKSVSDSGRLMQALNAFSSTSSCSTSSSTRNSGTSTSDLLSLVQFAYDNTPSSLSSLQQIVATTKAITSQGGCDASSVITLASAVATDMQSLQVGSDGRDMVNNSIQILSHVMSCKDVAHSDARDAIRNSVGAALADAVVGETPLTFSSGGSGLTVTAGRTVPGQTAQMTSTGSSAGVSVPSSVTALGDSSSSSSSSSTRRRMLSTSSCSGVVDVHLTELSASNGPPAPSSLQTQIVSVELVASVCGSDIDGSVIPVNNTADPIHVTMHPSAGDAAGEQTLDRCQYYDTARNVWSFRGCITVVNATGFASCACYHLTDFGALRQAATPHINSISPVSDAKSLLNIEKSWKSILFVSLVMGTYFLAIGIANVFDARDKYRFFKNPRRYVLSKERPHGENLLAKAKEKLFSEHMVMMIAAIRPYSSLSRPMLVTCIWCYIVGLIFANALQIGEEPSGDLLFAVVSSIRRSVITAVILFPAEIAFVIMFQSIMRYQRRQGRDMHVKAPNIPVTNIPNLVDLELERISAFTQAKEAMRKFVLRSSAKSRKALSLATKNRHVIHQPTVTADEVLDFKAKYASRIRSVSPTVRDKMDVEIPSDGALASVDLDPDALFSTSVKLHHGAEVSPHQMLVDLQKTKYRRNRIVKDDNDDLQIDGIAPNMPAAASLQQLPRSVSGTNKVFSTLAHTNEDILAVSSEPELDPRGDSNDNNKNRRRRRIKKPTEAFSENSSSSTSKYVSEAKETNNSAPAVVKGVTKLPHHLIFLGYSLCFIYLSALLYISLLYSVKFDTSLFDMWMQGSFVSLGLNVFVLDPLKIVMLAVGIPLIKKLWKGKK